MHNIPFKNDPDQFTHNGSLFATNVFDLLPDDHHSFVYETFFQQIDVSSLVKKYSVRGQRAYHPRRLISILIYAYCHGVFGSRKIKQKCCEDLGFMYISHLHCPDFRTLSDFRKNNYEFFVECFKQTVLLAREAGLASLGHPKL